MTPPLPPTRTHSLAVRTAPYFWLWGAFNLFAATALAAVYAHAPLALDASQLASAQSALQQQAWGGLGILLAAWLAHVASKPNTAETQSRSTRLFLFAALAFTVGELLFSWNLHARHLAQFDALRRGVPAGGMAMMLAWLALGVGGFLQLHTPN